MPGRVDVEALEQELMRLPGVTAARAVFDRSGHPLEIHVLSTTAHDPRKVVRDVQTIALSSFGIEVDRRVVSVARLADKPTRRSRPIVAGVDVETRGVRCVTTVTLELEGQRWTGSADGSPARSARRRAAGVATLDALRRIVPALSVTDIETPRVVSTPERDVVVVDLTIGAGDHRQRVCGSAEVRDAGDVDAAVRAVLDATNRRLAVLSASGR